MPNPEKNPDLHGNVPDESPTALLLIDVLNMLEFEGSQPFVARAEATAQRIRQLKAKAKRAAVPVIYVNDNTHGRWRSDLTGLLRYGLETPSPGQSILRALAPDPDDYVVLKPKLSGFYATPLETLLLYLKARSLVLTGFTADQCVLFTAGDAYIRDYSVYVPNDCTDTVDPADAAPALHLMRRRLHVDTHQADELDWEALKRPLDAR
jgi:nicotinamidase-related amidase